MSNIPKVVFQTSKEKPLPDQVSILMQSFPEWEYLHFNDEECLDYMLSNKIDGINNPEKIFSSYSNGAHRADFFRYYYMYINGGVFIDSDLMMYTNMNSFISNYDFFSCFGSDDYYKFLKNTVFQGFLGASKQNDIIYQALYSMSNIDKKTLIRANSDKIEGYLIFIRQMFNLIKKDSKYNKKMIVDKHFKYISELDNKEYVAFYLKDNNKNIGIHWSEEKVVRLSLI
jgi:hypothetical protein